MRICHVTTSDITLEILFAGQLRYKIDLGFEVWAISSPGPHVAAVRAQGVHVLTIPMARASVRVGDLTALFRLIWFFAFHRFDIVELSTPKAMLLGAIAAWLTRQPLRIVTIRGAHWDGRSGWWRRVLMCSDRLGCALAHRVVAISHELRSAIVRERICRADKAVTYLSGSSNGIDLSRFTPTAERVAFGRDVRRRHGIADDALVIGAVGRLRVEKGIVELLDAFETLLARGRNVYLLLVGFFDTVDPIPADVRQRLQNHPRVIMTGHQPQPELYYPAMDLFAFPTYREGFGNVALEASAMGLPLVASDVIGCRESAPAGIAAIAVAPRSAAALAEGLERLLSDPELSRRLAAGGQKRVCEEFARERIWRAILADYASLLAQQGKVLPPRAAAEAALGRAGPPYRP